MAAAGTVTDINPVLFLRHGVIRQFRGAPRQVGATVLSALCLCTAVQTQCVCGDSSCTWPSKRNVCSSTDVLSSPPKEIAGQPPALPPKHSRISRGQSATSPPPISPPPTLRLQQELHPKLHHTAGDVDSGQPRFCVCGISSHIVT